MRDGGTAPRTTSQPCSAKNACGSRSATMATVPRALAHRRHHRGDLTLLARLRYAVAAFGHTEVDPVVHRGDVVRAERRRQIGVRRQVVPDIEVDGSLAAFDR